MGVSKSTHLKAPACTPYFGGPWPSLPQCRTTRGWVWERTTSQNIDRARRNPNGTMTPSAGPSAPLGFSFAVPDLRVHGNVGTTTDRRQRVQYDRSDATYDRIAALFHLTQRDASTAFSLGMTSFKKLCRQNGVLRWPNRHVRPMPHRRVCTTHARLNVCMAGAKVGTEACGGAATSNVR